MVEDEKPMSVDRVAGRVRVMLIARADVCDLTEEHDLANDLRCAVAVIDTLRNPWLELPAVPTPGEAPFDGRPVLLWSPYAFEPGGHAWVSGGWGNAAISPNEFRGQTGRQWPTHYASLPSAPDAPNAQ